MIHIGISGPIASGKSTLAKDLQTLAQNQGYVAEIVPFASGIREIMALEFTAYRRESIARKIYDWGYELDAAWKVGRLIDVAMSEYPSTGVKNRRLLQIIGTEIGRDTLDKDVWIKRAQQLIRGYEALDFAISDDLRFDNEAMAVDVHVGIDIDADLPLYFQRVAQFDTTYTYSNHASERGLSVRPLLEIGVGFTGREVSALFQQLDYIRRVRL